MTVTFHGYTHCENTYSKRWNVKDWNCLISCNGGAVYVISSVLVFYYYLILASWIHRSSVIKDRDKFGTRWLRFKVDFRIINALFHLHLYDSSHLGEAMVGMVTSSSVDHGFERRLSQPKDYKICMFCFCHILRTVRKDWLALNQYNVSDWSDMSTHGVLLQWDSN